MAQTNNQVPSIVIANTLPGVDWQNPNNILFSDGTFAIATGNTQILTVSYVGKINVPVGATINNIVISVKGYRGSFNTTLQIYAIDFTSGSPVYYLMSPSFQGFDGTNTLYTLPSTLFSTTWTVDAINNLGLKLVADGELYLDTIEANVLYTAAVPVIPVTTLQYNTLAGGVFGVGNTITGGTSGATGTVDSDNGINEMTLSGVTGTFQIGETISNGLGVTAIVANPTGSLICDEFVEALPFQLASSITSTSLTMLLNSFNYPDGVTPIQIADFHGEAIGVIDQGVIGKEEAVRIVDIQQNYNGAGQVLISFGTLANRGLGYQYPYTSVTALRQDHSGTAEFVLSNPAVFYDRFIKKCQADALFSVPIEVYDEAVSLTTSLHTLKFVGAGVVATLSAPHEVTVTINPVAPSVLDLEVDGVPNVDQTLLNLISGANITLVDDGVGGVIISSTGGGGGGGGGGNIQVDQTPDNGTYGLLAGDVDGVNTTYTVSLGVYITGKMSVYLNGLVQLQGAADDWEETDPATGTFDFIIPPLTGDIITVIYQDTQGSTGESLTFAVNQVGHGLSEGDVIKSNGTDDEYAKAQADSSVNAEVVGIVTSVVDADNFIYSKDIMGYDGAGIPAGTPGVAVFLSPSVAGDMTLTEPTTAGQISKPIGVLLATGAKMNFSSDIRGQEVQPTAISGGGTKIAVDTTQQIAAPGPAVYSVNIPGGTLGTNNAIRFRVLISDINTNGNSTFDFGVSYGGTLIATAKIESSSVAARGVFLEGIIVAHNSANVQKGIISVFDGLDTDATTATRTNTVYGTAAEDSSVDQVLEISIVSPDNAQDLTCEGIIVEQITPAGGAGGVTYANGITTKATSDASTTQNIAHGLGSIPSKIRLTFLPVGGTTSPSGQAVLAYNGTTKSVVGLMFVNGALRDMSATDIKLYGPTSGNELEFQTGVVTFDASNIIITWTKTNSPTGTFNIMWEAEL